MAMSSGEPYSYLTHLECSRCGQRHEASVVQGLCQCGGPLLARYDLAALKARFAGPGALAGRAPAVWRYHELLPVADPANIVSLGETTTPLVGLPRLGAKLGLPGLAMKDEGRMPTGTFKARGAAVGISRAAELGVAAVAMPTHGNAGAAWSAYAARAGMRSLIVMPVAAPAATRAECVAAGAELYLMDGLMADAAHAVAEAVAAGPWFDAATLKEPYRIEGKKTIALELAEQLGWRVPDVIIYPAGGGVGMIGIFKALRELRELGWIGPALPRLVAVQSTGCAPIVRAFEEGKPESEPWADPSTVAFGLGVAKALGDFLVLDAIAATGGCAVAVSDAEILQAQGQCAALEGLLICPEGAATLAAAGRLCRSGWLPAEAEVVVVNTGTGLKYPSPVPVEPIVLAPGDRPPA